MVADHETPRPISGASTAIVGSGSKEGLANAPLLERPLGRGAIVHCQLKLVEKATAEPAAATILGNLLQYLANYRPTQRKTALIGGNQQYRQSLQDLGLRFDNLTKSSNLADYSTVICRGRTDASLLRAEQLGPFVEAGGTLFLHRPSPETMDVVCRELNLDLAAHAFSGAAKRADRNHPLLEAIIREDLYWTVKQPGLSWARQPLSREMIDSTVGPRFDPRSAETYNLEDWTLEGTYVHAQPQSVMFASAGTATSEIDFPESGKYGIGIRARGTPCKGVYPVAEFCIDGKTVGSVQLEGREWQTLGVVDTSRKGRMSSRSPSSTTPAHPPTKTETSKSTSCTSAATAAPTTSPS